MIKLKNMIDTSFNLIKKAMDRRNKLRFNLEFQKKQNYNYHNEEDVKINFKKIFILLLN